MKQLFAIFISILVWGTCSIAEQLPIMAKVLNTSGDVIIKRSEGIQNAGASTYVLRDDQVISSINSFASIQLIDNRIIVLKPSSTLLFKDTQNGDLGDYTSSLILLRGGLKVINPPDPMLNRVKVYTSDTLVTPKTGSAIIENDGITSIVLLEGELSYVQGGAKEVALYEPGSTLANESGNYTSGLMTQDEILILEKEFTPPNIQNIPLGSVIVIGLLAFALGTFVFIFLKRRKDD